MNLKLTTSNVKHNFTSLYHEINNLSQNLSNIFIYMFIQISRLSFEVLKLQYDKIRSIIPCII